MFRLKLHAATFAVIIGLLTIFNQTAQGQTIINPSFEVDARPPGNGDGAITGWTGGSGINTVTGPFTDNGTIPDGQKVAFIYGPGTMRQTVSGFTIGNQYRLRYYENARHCCVPRSANLRVTVGGVVVMATHEVVAVGGTNPYVLKVSEPFTAAAQALEIAFITSGTGDYTVLLDKIEIGRNLIVTNNNDGGAGSLRQTMIDAPAGSTISFSNAVRGTISLSGHIAFDKNLTIVGPGADALILSGGGVLVNSGETAAVSGLTISDGAGILNSGNLILTDSTVRRNNGDHFGVGVIYGGGIRNGGGTLTVASSVISENDANLGGGIFNGGGTVTITDSTISQNTANAYYPGVGRGGGIFNDVNGSVTVNNSTITGNLGGTTAGDAERGGGGLTNAGGILTLTNSTVSGNLARVICVDVCPSAAGIKNEYGKSGMNILTGQVNLINTTVSDNIENSPLNATVNARNSIVASFNGTLNSQGYNLINTSNTTITGVTTGNLLNTDARLGPLGFYGGPTRTHALLSGSPAINAGNTVTSPATDQRRAPRVGAADIGALELNNSANGGNFVARLPDAFTQIAYSYLINQGGGSNSLSGGAPSGFSLINEGYVSIGGRTNQIGVFNFSVTTTSGANSFVTDYSIRVLSSGLPPPSE